jgi:hypothetical protein
VKGGTAISSFSDETTRLEDDTRCRRTGVQAPFEAAGFLALPPRRDSRDPCVGVPPTSESWRATLTGLAAREPSAAAHPGLASRSAELLINPAVPLAEWINDRDPCLAELLLHLGGEQTPGAGRALWPRPWRATALMIFLSPKVF